MLKVKILRYFRVVIVSLAAMGFAPAHATPLSTGGLIWQGGLQYELPLVIDNVLNMDERGAADNFVWSIYLGAGASITSLRWDVNVTSYEGSYLSEMQMTFSDSLGNGITFTPGDGDDTDGTMDYAGFQDFADLGNLFNLGSDGILRLEFHDGFKDLGFDEPEGVWNYGTLNFGVTAVPEPPTTAIMLGALLLLSGVMRQRHLSPPRA